MRFEDIRFLIVEDQAPVRMLLRNALQQLGAIHIDQACSHGDAVHRMRKSMPHMVLCDFDLGNGRTGQQLLEEMRRIDGLSERVGWMMVTAESAYEQVLAVAEWAPDEYLLKPVIQTELDRRIRKIVAKKVFFNDFLEARDCGNYDAAWKALGALPTRSPYQLEVLRYRADLALRCGDATRSLSEYSTIEEVHPFPWAMSGVARSHLALGNTGEAKDTAKRLMACCPQFLSGHDLLADIHWACGETVEAQAVLEGAVSQSSRNYRRKHRLAMTAAANGHAERALSLLQEVLMQDVISSAQPEFLLDAFRVAACHGGDTALVVAKLERLHGEGALSHEEKTAFECLRVASGMKEHTHIPSLDPFEIPVSAAPDAVLAALAVGDDQAADSITAHALASDQAKEVFHALQSAYRSRGAMERFKRVLHQVALTRAKRAEAHSPAPAAVAA